MHESDIKITRERMREDKIRPHETKQESRIEKRANLIGSLETNYAVRQEMAEALLSQGLNEEAVCRLLNIAPELIPVND